MTLPVEFLFLVQLEGSQEFCYILKNHMTAKEVSLYIA